MQSLTLTTSLTSKKQLFVSRHDFKATLYVCGVTPYDYAHIGHGRCYTTFDLLYRVLQALSYKVTYCRNFTDIDDKLINRAQKELGDGLKYEEIATKYINAFHEDMRNLDCLAPTFEPRVTENISEIITMIEGLIRNGYAYVVGGDVYFPVKKFKEYGKLSHRKLDDLLSGARVAVSQEKQDPLDFALWKAEAEGTFWQSPWGWGRPGWHIECSALALKFLGDTIDIHGGGMDLIFPHHENEIAQSESFSGVEFAKYWVHNAFVRINKEKMSKSLGNFFTLRDVFEKFDPMVLRYYYLTHHYRSPLDFSWDDLAVAQKSYQRLCKHFAALRAQWQNFALPAISHVRMHTLLEGLAEKDKNIIESMLNFICDDLNTPGMFGVVFEQWDYLAQNELLAQRVYIILSSILGLTLQPLAEKEVAITPEIQALLDARETARKEKNWKRADELRDQLKAMGYEIQDKKLG